jgi:di/tricarboxylate transporter
MTFEIGLVFTILGAAVLLFVTGWIRADIVALLVLVSLVVTGLLPADEALEGFSSEAVIAIGGLLILSAGLVRTGVMRWIAGQLNTLAGNSRKRLILLSTSLPGFLSGLVSDIATVSLFIPVVLRLARQNEVPRQKLLLPIAMAALAGGNLTLIGASHNLVVNSLMQDAGQRGLSFFELAPVGLALVVIVSVYTLLFQKLLPGGKKSADAESEDRSQLVDTYHMHERLWEVWVDESSPVVSKALHELAIGEEYGLTVLAVVHKNHETHLVRYGKVELQPGDTLLLTGRRERVEEFVQKHAGLKLIGHPREQEDFPISAAEMIEVVVPPRSEAVGKSLAELNLRAETGLTGVALWRDGSPLRTDVGTQTLQPGDALLLYGARENTRSFDPDPELLWYHKPRQEQAPRELRHLGKWAFLIMAAVIISAGLELVPVAVAALGGAAAMMLIGAVNPRTAYENVEWRTIVLVGGMYPLGLALENSGASEFLSSALVNSLGSFGPLAALMGIFLVSMLLTQSLHGAAVAVIMTPVALSAASQLEVEPRAFAVAVIVGAAANYLLPVGHPAPLLVQGPGKYKTMDYVRFGTGLALLTAIAAAILLPLLWPF